MERNDQSAKKPAVDQEGLHCRETGRAFLIGLFIVTVFFVTSQAVDIFVFHLFVHIHLAIVAMVIMMAWLAAAIGRTAFVHLKALKGLAAVTSGWIIYLFINGALGINPFTSLVFGFRFVAAMAIAFGFAILFRIKGPKAVHTVGLALIFTFLLITAIWILQSINSPAIMWIVPLLRDQAVHPGEFAQRVQGLYVNPNILAVALVLHTAVLIWFTFHKIYSAAVIPVAWSLGLWGVAATQSKNAFLGIICVGVLSLFGYYNLFLTKTARKTKIIVLLSVLAVFVVASASVPREKTVRLYHALSKAATFDWKSLNTATVKEKLMEIDKARLMIWKQAFEEWTQKPLTGIGLGCFKFIPIKTLKMSYYHAHNFLLNVLVEQGLIGMGFLIAFLSLLIYRMKSWVGVALLACFLSTQIFDDETTSVDLPIYMSLMLGYCLHLVLEKNNIHRHPKTRENRNQQSVERKFFHCITSD